MTLPASGPIGMSCVDVELGFPATNQICLNSPAVRTLFGVPSGAIGMANGYGKSNRVAVSYTFASPASNQTLALPSLPGYSAGKSDITITVNSGVYVWSSSTGTSALSITGGTTGDTLKLVNNGYIMGQGGAGGTYPGPNSGAVGGPAISLSFPITIDNTNPGAYIGGGGGGGGGNYYTAGAGGGGAGGGPGGSTGPFSGTSPVGKNTGGAGGSIGNPGSAGGYCGPFSSLRGAGGGAGGGGGATCCPGTCAPVTVGAGGGGGRIFPGTGGTGGMQPGTFPGQQRGTGGSGNSAGTPGTFPVNAQNAGGGGGWGASGGNSVASPYPGSPANLRPGAPGGSGGNAVTLNGQTVTWKCSNTTRVYGAVA